MSPEGNLLMPKKSKKQSRKKAAHSVQKAGGNRATISPKALWIKLGTPALFAMIAALLFFGIPGIKPKLSSSAPSSQSLASGLLASMSESCAYAGSNDDCLLGKLQATLEKAGDAGLYGDKQVKKFAEVIRNHKLDPIALTKEQGDRAGTLAKSEWATNNFKHQKARTEVEAKSYSLDGEAQYYPRDNAKHLEEASILYGQSKVKGGATYYFHKHPGTVGFANGKPTRWVRAEVSGNSYHGHPRDVKDVVRDIPGATE
jgi:hypothetical protein